MKKKIIEGIKTGVVILMLTSCTKGGSSPYGNNNYGNNNNTGSSSNTVSIANMAFSASSSTVNKGTTITWTNMDDMAHTVTADDNSFTSGNLNKGDTYSHAFNAVATVGYHCKIHPNMTAKVIVK